MKRVLCALLMGLLVIQMFNGIIVSADSSDKLLENKTELRSVLEKMGTGEIHGYGEYLDVSSHERAERFIQLKGLPAGSIVLLYSHGSVSWNVSADEPGKIKGIIALGDDEPLVKTEMNVPVYRGSENQIVLPKHRFETMMIGGYKSFCEETEALLGRSMTTYFSGGMCDTAEPRTIVLDGKRTDGQDNQPKNPAGSTKMGQINASRVTFHSAKGNKIVFKDVCWESYYRSNKAYKAGKHYFEVELFPSNKKGVTERTNLGIGTLDASYTSPLYTGSNMDGSYSYGALFPRKSADTVSISTEENKEGPISSKTIRKGDRIGVAMDLDNHRVYFSKNGKWMNGDPADSSTGWEIKEDRYYYALGNVDCPEHKEPKGDVEVFYFGDKPFKYKMPEGYVAFGSAE